MICLVLDGVFVSKQKKLMKSMKFPKELDLKVDPTKVNWVVMAEWVAKRVTELLGVEDEVLIQFIHNKLQEKKASRAWCILFVWSITVLIARFEPPRPFGAVILVLSNVSQTSLIPVCNIA